MGRKTDPKDELAANPSGHQEEHLSLTKMAFVLGMLLVLVLATMGVVRAMSKKEEIVGHVNRYLAPDNYSVRQSPNGMSGPRLQVDEIHDWKTYKAEQDRLLNTYGWQDKEAGVARIPIERAMELVIERGLPARSLK